MTARHCFFIKVRGIIGGYEGTNSSSLTWGT